MIRVGVRGSDLALAYAKRACDELSCETEIVVIKTMGDLNPDVPIHEMGGKGVFCSAIETALINNEIDVAVHSLKDMPGDIEHPDLVVASYLKRNDPHDVLIGNVFEGCVIGSSSPRRKEQIQELYGHLNVEIKHIRGNIDTRLQKLDDKEYDAIILAKAGLDALAISRICKPLDIIPAVGQGTTVLQCRKDDVETIELVSKTNDDLTMRQSFLERALLKGIMGDCSTSIAAFAYDDAPIKMDVVYY
jgi:hydroxymethylbilane synthase|tara:strand:+ start:4206 stop:4946 length:741 start_codon:yes stop_codon:yes gene_type:complete